MADSLPDVPNEIKLRILEFAATIDTTTGLAVCLTDKKLGLGAGRKGLYGDIKIPSLGQNQRDYELRWKKCILLCRTLLKDRSLAGYIESLDVCLCGPFQRRNLHRFEKEIRNLFKNLMSEELRLTPVQLGDILGWFNFNDERGNTDMKHIPPHLLPRHWLGIMMIACPNLKVLGVEGLPEAFTLVAELRRALQSPRLNDTSTRTLTYGFESMQQLKIRYFGIDAAIGVLLNLPALKKLTIDEPYDDEQPDRIENLVCSTLQELHVTMHDKYAPQAIFALLKRCPNLKIFTLTWIKSKESQQFREFRLNYLAVALTRYCPRLETLFIDVQYKDEIRDSLIDKGLGNLHGLQHLRKLAAPRIVLSNIFDDPGQHDRNSALPNSVEVVAAFCEGMEFTADDRALLDAPGTRHLKDITIFNSVRDELVSKRTGPFSLMQGYWKELRHEW